MKIIKTIILFFMIMICKNIYAVDIQTNCVTTNCTITSQRVWNQFNQVYLFKPTQPQNSIYFFIVNRNTTSPHSFNLDVYQTPANSIADYTNHKMFWTEDSVNGNCKFVKPNSMTTCWVTTAFASQIAIVISNATTSSGSPDTGDLYITQGEGEPKGQGSGQSFSTDPFQQQQQISEHTYSFTGTYSNPAANRGFIVLDSNTVDVYYNRLIVSSDAAAQAVLQLRGASSTTGSTCTLSGFSNTNLDGTFPTAKSAVYDCSAINFSTSGNALVNINIVFPAGGGTMIIPLTDYYTKRITKGIMGIFPASITGNINVTLTLSEQ